MEDKFKEINQGWEKSAWEKYGRMIAKIPVFLRPIAEEKVGHTAEKNARENHRDKVNEKDMVDAFFSETPFGFHGPMKTDMQDLGIDYRQYGHPE